MMRISRGGRRLLTAMCVLGCAASAVGAATPAGVGTIAAPSYMDQHNGPHRQSSHVFGSSGSNLIDFGGKIVPASHVYAIYWGTPSAFPSDLQTGVTNLFNGLNGSTLLGIGRQYMRGSGISDGFVRSAVDTSPPPSHSPSTSTIANEVLKETSNGSLPLDSTGIYMVYTSNFPRQNQFCAWHTGASISNTVVQFAYFPNTTGVAGCDPGAQFDGTGYSEGTRSLANVSSHEFFEAITDAVPTNASRAWMDSSGSEIGDKCAWQFSGGVKLGTLTWQLQEEWSNAINGCQQS